MHAETFEGRHWVLASPGRLTPDEKQLHELADLEHYSRVASWRPIRLEPEMNDKPTNAPLSLRREIGTSDFVQADVRRAGYGQSGV